MTMQGHEDHEGLSSKAFRYRVLVDADAAFWKFWRDRKPELKAAGFSIMRYGVGHGEYGWRGEGQWLLSYKPLPAVPPRTDRRLLDKRKAARQAYEEAVGHFEAARAAVRTVKQQLSRRYTRDERLADLADDVLAALATTAAGAEYLSPEEILHVERVGGRFMLVHGDLVIDEFADEHSAHEALRRRVNAEFPHDGKVVPFHRASGTPERPRAKPSVA
jgi:hypothetical protein